MPLTARTHAGASITNAQTTPGNVIWQATAAADANTDLVAGEIVILQPTSATTPNLYTARDVADSGVYHQGSIFGVVMQAIVDEAVGPVCVKGIVQALAEGDNTAVALDTPLVSSLALDAAAERALVPAAEMSKSGTTTQIRKVIALGLAASTSAGALVWVEFNGLEGFGSAFTLTAT